MQNTIRENELYLVIVNNKSERDCLYNFCIKKKVKILYPELFHERKIHHLWGLSKSGIGLVGTEIARRISKEFIIRSVNLLDDSIRF